MLFKRCFNRAEMKFIRLFYNNKLSKCGRSMFFYCTFVIYTYLNMIT